MSKDTWRIGVAGLGTVGGGLLNFLSERPGFAWMPPTLMRATRWQFSVSAASVAISPATTIPGRRSASHSGRRAAASATEAKITSMWAGTPMR